MSDLPAIAECFAISVGSVLDLASLKFPQQSHSPRPDFRHTGIEPVCVQKMSVSHVQSSVQCSVCHARSEKMM